MPRALDALLVAALTLAVGTATLAQDAALTYRDPQARFSFQYPPAFGTPGPGTDDGFEGRAAAVRFSGLAGLGGEAVLTRGPVMLDVQALGGLYDPIALQIFPDAVRAQVIAARPAVTHATFCRLLGAADHLGTSAGLAPNVRDAARSVDRMRNIDPRLISCRMAGDTIVFHKEATFTAGTASARQHIYGAIRFLEGPYSAFQFVRAGPTVPADADLETMERLVRSLAITAS